MMNYVPVKSFQDLQGNLLCVALGVLLGTRLDTEPLLQKDEC